MGGCTSRRLPARGSGSESLLAPSTQPPRPTPLSLPVALTGRVGHRRVDIGTSMGSRGGDKEAYLQRAARTKQELAAARENIRLEKETTACSRRLQAVALRDARQLHREQVHMGRERSLYSARALRDNVYSSKFVSPQVAKELQEMAALGLEYDTISNAHRAFLTPEALATRAESPPKPKPGWKV